MYKLVIPFLFCSCLVATIIHSQSMGPQSLDDLSESPAGSKIVLFLNTINNGEQIPEQFIKRIFSQRLIEKNKVGGLLGFLEDIRENDGQLELYDATREEMFLYKLKMKSVQTGNWLDSEVKFENTSPYRIDGFSVLVSSEKATAEIPMLTPEIRQTSSPKPKVLPPLSEIANRTDEIAKAYEKLNWFSGVILLAKEGKPFFQKAYGFADIENKIPNSLQTKFRIGSINKDYTDILIMQMVEKDQLNLEDRLSAFDLGFPKEMSEKITLRQIMTHQAGFADIFIPEYMDNIRAYKDIDDILPLLLQQPLIYEPGTDQRYSNYGYIVLGAIAEKITGKKFGKLLKENILDVLGTTTTHYDIAEHITGEAKSYRFTADGQKADHTSGLEYCTPDGGMYATAKDLLDFFQTYYYTEKLLTNQSKAIRAFDYETPQLSWKEIINNPRAGMATAGGGPGVNAVVMLEFADNFCAIVLANTDEGIAEQIEQRIRSVIRGQEVSAAQLPAGHYVYQTLLKEGEDYLVENISEVMKAGGYSSANSGLLNRVGYMLMRFGDTDKAIQALHTNARLFPDEANPWDSLAEAYYKKGDKQNALKYYRKALEVDPEFPSAMEMVKKIEG